jgi:hypothetical protein
MTREQGRAGVLTVLLRSLVVALVAAVVLVALATSRDGRSPATEGPVTPARLAASVLHVPPLVVSTVNAAQIICPSGAAFSPDGVSFAVLGPADTCVPAPGKAPPTHTLGVFDALAGTTRRIIPLEPQVLAAVPALAGRVRAMRFAGLGWTPDGTRYAAAFAAFDGTGRFTLDDMLSSGLLLVDVSGGAPEVILGDAGFFASAAGGFAGLPAWNLRDRTASPPAAVAPGLLYAWGGGTMPTAAVPLGDKPLAMLPKTVGNQASIGDPAGDRSFTVWQSGIVLGPDVAPPSAPPHDGAFVTAFPTWSSDRTRLTLLVAGVALQFDQQPSASQHGAAGAPARPAVIAPARLVQAPPRDAALNAVERVVGRDGWALVAWNPAGTLLADVTCAGAGPALEVRSTASGALVGAMALSPTDPLCHPAQPGENLGGYPNPPGQLLWSVAGGSLLLNDQASGAVEVWTVTA